MKIIIDTDPGQDDAVAILLALASPELDVLGITCVAGNVPLDLTVTNACKLVELSGKSVPVFAGCDRPLAKSLVTAEYVHGKTGLNGDPLPEPSITPEADHAVDFLIETLRAQDDVTLCPIGPLTNIATALQRAPDIAERIARIVLMGGAHFTGGNVTPAAEFNMYVDPEAAEIVFQSGVPLTVLPLDTTHQVLVTQAHNDAFRAAGRVGPFVASWTGFFDRYDKEKFGDNAAPLHDPCVIAWLLWPELFSGREVNVEIEVMSALTRGMSVTDWWRATNRAPNALFINQVEGDEMLHRLATRLATL